MLEWLGRQRRLLEELAGLDAAAAKARAALEATQAEWDLSDRAVTEAEQRLQAARDAGAVAGLRAHLAVGDECPVCERRIDTLPVAGDASGLAAAQVAMDAAQDRLQSATEDRRSAELVATEATTQAGGKRADLAEVQAQIAAAHPDAEANTLEKSLREALARVEATAKARRETGERVLKARKAQKVAADASVALQDKVREGWQQFRAARAGLLAWGCPTQEPTDLGQAWADLTAWARQQVSELDERELPELRDRRKTSAETCRLAEDALDSARAVLDDDESTATEATKR